MACCGDCRGVGQGSRRFPFMVPGPEPQTLNLRPGPQGRNVASPISTPRDFKQQTSKNLFDYSDGGGGGGCFMPQGSKRSLKAFLEDTAKSAALAKARRIGDKAQKAGENRVAKRAGLEPPHVPTPTAASSSSSSAAASSVPSGAAPGASSSRAEQVPGGPGGHVRCTRVTVERLEVFTAAMERLLETKSNDLLRKAVERCHGDLRVSWAKAVADQGENSSFGAYLWRHLDQTKAQPQMQRLAFAQSLIQQQRERRC